MTSSTPPAAPGDRYSRLPKEREHDLYDAVLQVLRDVGYEGLTMDTVSVRAHVSKATLYRRWHSKSRLVVAALRHAEPAKISTVDTGSLRGDLHEVARRVTDRAVESGALLSAVCHAMRTDEELARTLRETLFDTEAAALAAMARRAVDRGEADPAAPALPYFPQLVVAPVLTATLLQGEECDAGQLQAYFDAVVLPAVLLPG
ncbi:TetR/AcrR family transcriptional regulator [Streptacidiphilus sp. ASG 303]|uniref:TetR/AcrR family transcriptional regulator n=1 Tax=Streptacidiphilus sp. ASG 303 TaxID=2896847 RepID=UPI001E4C742F|nr:TetR/AcrR family transcriptional regulator [Streptacidiphilus sp. ASG 303]MCD0484220.1 TetR/AcrR family transcriptional regulator [Streptacidiphilus sp. ASG 303]